MKKILVDAFGSDYAPLEIIKGVVLAKKCLDCYIGLVGNKNKIEEVSEKNKLNIEGISTFDCNSEISNKDNPMEITKSKKDSSMAAGLSLLAQNKADALVSAGNSGALLVGASLILKRAEGVRRIAFAPFVPKKVGRFLFLDGGANIQCSPEILMQFAIMGSNYVKKVMNIENPKVGILNIGSEPSKGDDSRKEAFKLIESCGLNFGGNIEPSNVFGSDFDVVVSDGFAGNIFLKTFEGMQDFILSNVESFFGNDIILNGRYTSFKNALSPEAHGGTPLLGASKLVIKAHGNSKAEAIKNAIKLAYNSL